MIDVQKYIDKLEALKDYVYLNVCDKICEINRLQMYRDTGVWLHRVDKCPPTFERYIEVQSHNMYFQWQSIFE